MNGGNSRPHDVQFKAVFIDFVIFFIFIVGFNAKNKAYLETRKPRDWIWIDMWFILSSVENMVKVGNTGFNSVNAVTVGCCWDSFIAF